MIKIIFLGTADAVPSAIRNHTAVLLSYKDENILVDCGEGTQRQFRKAKLNPCRLTKLLISHWHGDHILGIPGLLQTLSLSGYNKKFLIYGPKGTKKFMTRILNTFVFRGKHPIEVKEISGRFFETKDFFLEAKPMTHGTSCNAYSFVKKGQIKIDKKKLKKMNIPSGKHLQKLKQRKDLIYNGRRYKAKNLTFIDDDKKISFVFDTSMNGNIIPLVKNSDLLICEASFDSGMKARARQYKHLTAEQAAQIAKKSKTKKLILTHISQRYEKNPKKILDEAQKIFKNSFLAKDLEIVEI